MVAQYLRSMPTAPLSNQLDEESTLELLMGRLDEQQRAAAETTARAAVVLAGAGTGKTTTMVSLLAKLVLIDGVTPERILMSTFTKAAAASMKVRLEGLFSRIGYVDEARPYIGTFHGFAFRLLKKEFRTLGYDKAPEPIDDEDLKNEVKAIIKTLTPKDEKPLFSVKPFVAALGLAANKRISIGEAISPLLPSKARLAGIKLAEKCYSLLMESLRSKGVLTYDQMISRWIEVAVANPSVAQRLAGMLDVIIVDEFQDNNRLLYDFIQLLNPARRIMVGDVNQCIYSFRGSDVSLVKQFTNENPSATVHQISTNYRSGQAVLDVANRILEGSSYPMTLRPGKNNPRATVLPRCCHASMSVELLADFAEELLRDGVPANEICFLFRSASRNQTVLGLELQLKSRQIPTRVLAGMSLSKRLEVKDFACLLTMIYNPKHPVRAVRACSLFAASQDAKYVKEAASLFGKMMDGKMEADLLGVVNYGKASARAIEIADRLVGWVQGCRLKSSASEAVHEMLRLATKTLSDRYRAASKHDAKVDRKVRDRMERLAQIAEQSSAWPKLTAMVEDLLGLDPEKPRDGEASTDTVTISTIHSAKGLEWGYVVLVDPTEHSFSLEPRTPRSADPDDEDDDSVVSLPTDPEEARRLLYVAVTRAKSVLVPIYQIGGLWPSEPTHMIEAVSWDLVGSANQLVSDVIDDLGNLPFATR